MPEIKTKAEVAAIYAAVASPEKLLYHVAHARKENTDEGYDGEALIEVARRRLESDLELLRAAGEQFRATPIPRPKI